MSWRSRLDRLWTIMVGVAFVIVTPVLIIVRIQEYGWPAVAGLLALIGAGVYYGLRHRA